MVIVLKLHYNNPFIAKYHRTAHKMTKLGDKIIVTSSFVPKPSIKIIVPSLIKLYPVQIARGVSLFKIYLYFATPTYKVKLYNSLNIFVLCSSAYRFVLVTCIGVGH